MSLPGPSTIMPPRDFPVRWDSPEDERGFWTLDRMHFPDPVPLALFDFLPEASMNNAAPTYDAPVRFQARRLNTYQYSQFAPPALPPAELAAMGQRAFEKVGAAMARLGELWDGEWLPEIKQHLAYWDSFDRAAASMPALLGHFDETWTRLRRVWDIHFLAAIPFLLSLSQFDELYRELFGADSRLGAFKLLQGFDNKTVEIGRELWRLSRSARTSPVVKAVLEEQAAEAVIPTLRATAEGQAFLTELEAFLATYGARGDKFSCLVDPSWIEEPTPVIQQLQDYLSQPDRDWEGEQRALAEEREQAIRTARQALTDYPGPVAKQFEFLLRAAQVATVLSEDHGFWIDYNATYRARRVLLEFGRRFAAAGVLESADEVIHLTLDEIRQTARELPSIDRRALVSRRKGEIAHFRTIHAPSALGTPPTDLPGDDPFARAMGKFFGGLPPAQDESGRLKGTPGSAGTYRGPARIVRSISEAGKLQPGDVLVAETTAPPWTPLFAVAGAVVTDTGGVLSHCAVVAREYGIPAVVGVGTATTRLRDGQAITVNGTTGIIGIES